MVDILNPLFSNYDDHGAELAAKDAEIERLRDALQQVRDLLDDGTLVRDTSRDHETMYFLKQGMRIGKMVSSLREALGDE